MRLELTKTSFSTGEIGASLLGRTDVSFYNNACLIVENMLCKTAGSIITTPGTKYMGETKNSGVARLIRFVFSRTESYIIEIGAGYFRFYTSDGVVLSGASAYEVANDYTEDDLNEIQYSQLNDIIVLTHENHPVKRLIRTASDNWTLEDYDFVCTPFLDDNTNTASTISVSATAGTITITASTSLFTPSSATTAGHNGTFWKFGDTLTTATSDIEKQGYFKITTVSSATVAIGEVINTLSETGPRYDWGEGAWGDVTGYPSSVTFHEQRLFFGRTPEEPQKIWGSKSFIYNDFMIGAEDDDALNLQLLSNESNDIKWLNSGRVLSAGTFGGEFIISGDGVLTPSNYNVKKESAWGSESITPKNIGMFTYYIQRFGRKIRELFYDYNIDSYRAVDKTILNPEITESGIIDMAYQQNPEPTLWCVREDGVICTLVREVDQEVQGWTRQITDGYYESVEVIPSPTENHDEVWVIVKREINGSTKRYIEKFGSINYPTRQEKINCLHSALEYDAFEATDGTDIGLVTTGSSVTITSSAAIFDSGMVGRYIKVIDSEGTNEGEMEIDTYTSTTEVSGTIRLAFTNTSYTGGTWGISVTSITGLDHLEAKEVSVLLDGGLDLPAKTVSGATIDLATFGYVVNVGLPYDQKLTTLPIENISQQGSAVGKKQKINNVAIKLNKSYKGLLVGGAEDTLDPMITRDPTTYLGVAEELYTGILTPVTFRSDPEIGAKVYIKNTAPLPIEVLSLTTSIETYEK